MINKKKIINFFYEKSIESLNYLIHLDNLESILKLGILSRNSVIEEGICTKDISGAQYREYRENIFERFFLDEDISDYVPLYISSHVPMIHPIASPYYLRKGGKMYIQQLTN